jgi:hypothetical protein
MRFFTLLLGVLFAHIAGQDTEVVAYSSSVSNTNVTIAFPFTQGTLWGASTLTNSVLSCYNSDGTPVAYFSFSGFPTVQSLSLGVFFKTLTCCNTANVSGQWIVYLSN